MAIISNINIFFKALVDRNEPKLVNAVFVYFMFAFITDQVVNYFYHVPVFVVSALAIFPILLIILQVRNSQKRSFIVLVLSFIILATINNLVYGFHLKNISDLLFICLFIVFYYYYRNNTGALKVNYVYAFLFTSLLLFSFTFLAIDSESVFTKDNGQHDISTHLSPSDTNVTSAKDSLYNDSGHSKGSGSIHWQVNHDLDHLEYYRIYKNGLFRLPHVASYFFGFLFLFFTYRYWKKNKIFDLLFIAISFAFCLLTGSRAIIATIVISGILFLFKRRYIVYLQSIIIAGLLMVLGIEHILRFSENTVFYQYFSIIQTTTENITRLSRFRIWYSWWVEVHNFGILDFLIGKSYINAHLANIKNLGYDIWFHNDFLNIFFSYGIWATILYIWFFIKIYRDNRIFIKNNLFIFIFYFSMVITAVINGFYFYFPVFLLYLFWLMINDEKRTA